MKGTVQSKITKKGTEYLYIYLDYTDPITHKRKQKAISTGLEAKGNKRKAEKLIKDISKNISIWRRHGQIRQSATISVSVIFSIIGLLVKSWKCASNL